MKHSLLSRLAPVLLAAPLGLPAAAAPTGDALDRASIAVRSPEQAVLMAAAQAGARLVAVGERGIIALSDDAGRRWRQVPSPASVTLTAVHFADAQRGWAVGHGGVVLATDDGGQHWARQLDGRRAAQLVLDAAKAAGDAKATREAERLVADGPDKPWLDLLVFDARRLLVVGAYGLALASEDGGRTWSSWMARLPNPKGLHLYAARRHGNVLLLAGEQGLALLSTDDGQSFRPLDTPYKGSFFTAELTGEHDLVLAGLRGNVLHSSDGGATWAFVPTPMPVSITASGVANGGRFLAANQAGIVLALRNGVLLPLNAAPLPPVNGLLPLSGKEALALTVHGALPVSLDEGSKK